MSAIKIFAYQNIYGLIFWVVGRVTANTQIFEEALDGIMNHGHGLAW